MSGAEVKSRDWLQWALEISTEREGEASWLWSDADGRDSGIYRGEEVYHWLYLQDFSSWRWLNDIFEGRLSHLHFPWEGCSQIMPGQVEKHQVQLWGRKEQKIAEARAFIKASLVETRQYVVNSLGLASLRNSGRLWGKGAVPNCLFYDPGLI